VNASGSLFIADVGNNRVRRVVAATVRAGTSTAYTLTIRNISPATTDPVTVTAVGDNMLGDLTAAARAANGGADIVLSPGERFTFTANSPALGSGTVVVEVTVTAHDNEGTVVTASDTETLTVI